MKEDERRNWWKELSSNDEDKVKPVGFIDVEKVEDLRKKSVGIWLRRILGWRESKGGERGADWFRGIQYFLQVQYLE